MNLETAVSRERLTAVSRVNDADEVNNVSKGKVEEEDLLESVRDGKWAHSLQFRSASKERSSAVRLFGEQGERVVYCQKESVRDVDARIPGIPKPLAYEIPLCNLAFYNPATRPFSGTCALQIA